MSKQSHTARATNDRHILSNPVGVRTARQIRWHRVSLVKAKGTGDDGDKETKSDESGDNKVNDARAALLAKAAAYKKAAETDSKQMGGKEELKNVVSEAIRKVESGEADSDTSDANSFQQKQVKVKIISRDSSYNPFDEDEQVVGFEDNGQVFTPESGGKWGRDDGSDLGEKSKFASMLDDGRRRERGVGVDNDTEEVITRTTFDDERYNVKKAPVKNVDSTDQSKTESKTESDASSEEDAYKPKVSTWGVFPRPDNISKTYGGGKTIKAGEFKAETEEEKEERRARVKQKLNKYREDAGITVDNGTRRRWNMALQECQTLMRLGRLAEGRDLLEPIVLQDEINPRTQLGGEITFHYAMCLDNTQRREEALEMYKRCIGNPHGQVSKLADRMIWGMTTASTKMKADQFDYDTIKDKYDPFLIKMTTERQDWKIEKMDEEEEKALKNMTIGSILGVLAIPLALGAFIVFK